MVDEFGFYVCLFYYVLEVYKIWDILVIKDVFVFMWVDWWGFKMEVYDVVLGNVVMVYDVGG